MKEKKLQSRMGTLYILLSIQMGASLVSFFVLQMLQWPWLLFASTCRANTVLINEKSSQSSSI